MVVEPPTIPPVVVVVQFVIIVFWLRIGVDTPPRPQMMVDIGSSSVVIVILVVESRAQGRLGPDVDVGGYCMVNTELRLVPGIAASMVGDLHRHR